MRKPIKPTLKLRRRAEILATVSSCCGFLGEVTLTDSAVIILFAGMLGAGDMLSMITTSVLPLFYGICIIPMAALAARMGIKRIILTANAFAAAAYFVAVASPFFGGWSVAVLIGAILFFAFSLTGFIAGWFPLLDTFLTAGRRTAFFSRMRFSHQLCATCFLFIVGLLIGKSPPLGVLQLVLLVSGIVFIGRALAIARIPAFTVPERDSGGFREGLAKAVANKPLTGFSSYLFVLNLASFGTVPLMVLALKNRLGAPDNIVVLTSAASLCGMLIGYLCVNRLFRRLQLKYFLITFHALFLAVNLTLLFFGRGGPANYIMIAGLLFCYSFGIAAVSIIASAEMMALASPGNKVMAMAVSGAYSSGGSGLSRLLSSLLLGCGLIAPEWQLGAMAVSRYQSLLLIYVFALLFAAAFLPLVDFKGKKNPDRRNDPEFPLADV